MAELSCGLSNDDADSRPYDETIKNLTCAIEQDCFNAEAYGNRANAYLKIKKYAECVQDANKAIELGSKVSAVRLWKGMALFELGEKAAAKEEFLAGRDLDCSDERFSLWLAKFQTPPVTMRHDWYQTDSQVVITVLTRALKSKSLDVNIVENSVSVVAHLEDGSDCTLRINLAHPIDVNRSKWTQTTTKVEIKLQKADGIRWETLESTGTKLSSVEAKAVDSSAHPPKYPSSSQQKRDWDKIMQEIEKCDEEENKSATDETAVDKLFQKIYADGSDEVRKAMNKSFMESGGTVLSTNWKEVGEKPVEVKPPEGMEYKKWD